MIRVLWFVYKAWRSYPEQRFAQLVVNFLGTDPFYVEDSVTERQLRERRLG
jgi:hypothetical protein